MEIELLEKDLVFIYGEGWVEVCNPAEDMRRHPNSIHKILRPRGHSSYTVVYDRKRDQRPQAAERRATK